MQNEDDVIICRCEEITKSEIIDAIKKGASTVTMVKKMTRAGMGLCKGKTCSTLAQKLISQYAKKDLKDLDFDVIRAPLRPLKVEILGSFEEDEVIVPEDIVRKNVKRG